MLSGDSFMRSLVQENDVYLNLNQFNKEALEYANDKSHKDIVKEYLQYSGNCSELLNLLQGGRKSASQLATIFNTIECILLRISGDLNSYENVGREIVQKILQFNINCIYNLLKPANKSNQVKSALKLLIAICTQGIQSIKDLIVNFNFQNSSFLSIINRRNIKDPEDIRTCFIHFVVAILIIGDNTIIKNVIELKGFLNLVIHGLIYDRALIIHLILSTIQKRIVENSSISKTQKIRVLNDDTLKFVLKLYNWSGEKVNKFTNKRKHNSDLKEEIFVEKPASEEEINFVRDTAHQFMLSVCCSYKNGIIFSNWISNNNEKNPNHIITNLLKSLKTPYADKRSSDFIIKVLQTCPDQIKFYLPSLQDSFFPRNSVAWIQIMNLLKEIVISQNPLQLLLKPDGKLSISKVASQVIQFCIPSVLSKIIITENLKSYDPIIQYVLLDYLHILLKKLKNILEGNKLEFLSVGYNTDDFESFKTIVKENTFINFPDSSSVYCCLEDLVENIGKHYQKTAKIQEVLPIYNVVQHFQKIVEILELFGELYPNTFKENPLKIKTFLLEIRKYSSILKDQTVILEISILKLLLMFKHTSDLKEIEEFPFSFLLEVYLKTKDKNLLICSLKILKEFLFEFGFSEDSFWELNIWLKKLKYSSFSCHEKIVNFLEKVMKFAFNKSSYLENIITDCKKKILSTNILSDKYNNDIKEGEMKPFSILVPACLESLKTISSEDIKDVKYYLTEVLQEILHCQKEPKLLCSLLQQYDVLPSEFMNYINIWIPGFKFKNNILQISLSEELFINISALESFKTIYIHSKRSDILLYEKKIYKNFKLFVKKVENWEELQSVIRQIVFYITIEIQNEEINKDTVLLLLNFLNIIISIIQKKNDDRSFENINESDNISFSILLKDILSYSSVVYWFFTNELYQSELCAKLSSQLICFILNLITFINECSKLHKEIILKPYKYKLISWLQLNAAVLIKKKYIFKIITFETLINGFIHVLQPEEAKEILLVITKMDLLQIQKIDPECSVFIALLKCCLKDKTIDLMKFSDFRITYFHLLSLNLERNEIDELIDCALQMMQTHPNNLYSLDIELLIPLLRKLTLKTLHFIQLLLQHNSLSFKQILSFLSTEHQCMTQWSPQLIMNFINSCINIVSPKGKSLKKFLEIVSPYYWLIIKKVVKAKHENSEMNEITACNILSKLLQLNIIDKEKVVSLTEKICSNIDDNNMPLLFSTSIIIELFYSVEILKLNTKSVPAETALFMVLIKWLLYHLKEKSEVNESIIEIIMKLTDLSKKMDSNSLREILSDTLWSSVLQTLLKRGLNDLNNGNLMIRLLNIIIFTLYENNNMNISPSISVIFQMVFGHSNFISLILEDAKTCLTKESVVSLLITLVTIDCSVCNSEHIPLYLGAYQATMNKTDQSLLFLISLYENAGIQLTRYRPFLWGPIGINHYSLKEKSNLSLWKEPKIDDVINLLDNEKIWYSVLNFPLNLDLNPAVQELDEIELELDKIYDPRFLLSLFASLLIPGYLVNCKKFIEYKCLAFVFASLSSSVPNIRKIGYYILYLFHEHLEGSRFREKDIWLGILKLIKYNIGKSNVKLSCIVSLFLCKITHYAFKSEDPMYKPLMQFLTLKPTLDLFNVPEFYKFFNSSNIVNNVEQEWILNHLKEGLRTSFDFHTCEQRYIFRILLAFYSSPVCNQFLKLLILNILIQAVKIPLVARQMHKKYGLLTWIINVIYNGKPSEEEITKLKLIVNILQKNIIQMTESIQSEIV